MRTMGTVKWFDPETGAGYAVSEGGMQAGFAAALLQPFGLSTIDAGVQLTYDVKLEGGRLVVGLIHEIGGHAPVRPFQTPPRGTRWRGRGQVISCDGAKGFGMVAVEGHDYDALLHHQVLKERFGVATIGTRTVLDCAFERGFKGTKVTKIYGVLEVGDPPPRERVLGTVDWFDPVKGFGFVRTTEGDAMLHMREVNELGRVTIGAGAKIDCDIIREVSGLRICRVNCVLSEGELPPSATMDTTCKWFSRPKGFGLLKADTDADVFIHMDTLRRVGLRELRQGQRLRVLALRREKGLVAISVEGLLG